VLHWNLDEGAGNAAKDSSGNGQDGTIGGTAHWVKGMVSGALQFDGKTNYIAVDSLNINTGIFSVALWIMPTGVPYTTGYQSIFHDDTWTWGSVQAHLRAETSLVNVDVYGGGAVTSTTALQSNHWYHILATFEKIDTQNGVSKLYINGVLENTKSGWASTPALGALNFGAWTKGSRFFPGVMDDIRIYDHVVLAEEIPAIMLGERPKELASGPVPKDQTTDVPRDEVLIWTPGEYAATHNVYFGTNSNDVNNATATSPLLVSTGQAATTYQPTILFDFGQTYYWRVDEVNAPNKPGLFKGSTWSFTAETYGRPITTPIKATASSQSNTLTGPEKTIDGSGLNAQDQHSIDAGQMWLSKSKQTPVWIQYEFDQVYNLHQMWVWNQNQITELDDGNGALDVTIETSIDGTTWTALANVPQFAQATAEDTYVHNTTVDFGGIKAKFVRLNILSNWGDARQSGLAEVRFFYVPLKAFGPTPVSGTTDVAVDSLLNWRPGRTAAGHEVYFGADPNALTKVGTATGHTYSLVSAGAEYEKTYYWKVNEVNGTDTWAGDVWSFSTAQYFVVDDFESYDDKCNRIFYTWADGYGAAAPECGGAPVAGNGSGSTVGNASAPYAERTVVHGGSKQSMPMAFDNPGATSYSEATRTFAVGQDWVQGGVKTLVLYFRGVEDNAAGQIYVKINNSKVVYNGNAQALTLPVWKQWNIDLSSVGGSLRSVTSLTIGVSGSGKGTVYIDDILLYRSAPAVVQPVDPGTTGLSAYYMMDGDMKDSSGKGYNGTVVNDPVFVDSRTGFGKALQFDGTDDHVDLPIGPLISSLTSTTITTWANFTTTSTGSWVRIFDFGTGVTSGNPLIYMFLTPRQSTAGAMRFAITTGSSGGEQGLNAPGSLSAGWHHVAVVIDGSAMTLRLYLDGDVVASGATTVLPKDLGVTTQNRLGRSQWSADGYYQGLMDEFRIYNRALSDGEVRYLAGDR
jgi:hypothetical protein